MYLKFKSYWWLIIWWNPAPSLAGFALLIWPAGFAWQIPQNPSPVRFPKSKSCTAVVEELLKCVKRYFWKRWFLNEDQWTFNSFQFSVSVELLTRMAISGHWYRANEPMFPSGSCFLYIVQGMPKKWSPGKVPSPVAWILLCKRCKICQKITTVPEIPVSKFS